MNQDPLSACQASLQRSRTRRAAAAARRAIARRRRRRGSTASVAIVAALALGAPLAVGQTTAQAPTTLGPDAVRAVQAALGVVQTGHYGPLTRQAVRAFQRREGLVVDGIVGPQTAAALGLDPAPRAVAASAGGTLARIAACESGGDPTAVSADGRYRGKYQFSRATWQRMGGTGDPAAAPEAEQDRRAAALLAAEGTAPWPACG